MTELDEEAEGSDGIRMALDEGPLAVAEHWNSQVVVQILLFLDSLAERAEIMHDSSQKLYLM